MRELWPRPISGYEDRYLVSDTGRVFSLRSRLWLKPVISDEGYHGYSLWDGKVYKGHFAHRLVLTVYDREPIEGEEALHIDNDPSNNRRENLRWGTKSENQQQRLEFGTDMRGEKHPRCKLTNGQVQSVKSRLSQGEKGKDIANDLGVSPSLISLIKRGKVRAWLGEVE